MSRSTPSQIPFDQLSENGFAQISQLIPNVLPFSKRTLKRLVQSKVFPAPVSIPRTKSYVWKVSEDKAWLKAQSSERGK